MSRRAVDGAQRFYHLPLFVVTSQSVSSVDDLHAKTASAVASGQHTS